jgi:hypothetical protein
VQQLSVNGVMWPETPLAIASMRSRYDQALRGGWCQGVGSSCGHADHDDRRNARMIFFVVLVVLLLAGTALIVGGWRRRMPAELDPDWWARFERDFRAYAQRVSHRRADNQ